ncbi:MAG: hypothetical protein V4473_01425 [Patescibacteria group bacterium]
MKNVTMKKNTILFTLLLVLVCIPLVSFAAPLDGLKGLLIEFKGMLNTIIELIFGLALVYFFWGMAQFILNAGVEKAREEGKNKMIWGIIALFVMFSIYGILNWISNVSGIKIQDNLNSTGSSNQIDTNFNLK